MEEDQYADQRDRRRIAPPELEPALDRTGAKHEQIVKSARFAAWYSVGGLLQRSSISHPRWPAPLKSPTRARMTSDARSRSHRPRHPPPAVAGRALQARRRQPSTASAPRPPRSSGSSPAGETVYGVNTGFGLLASTRIPADRLAELQRNLILSHSCGLGDAAAAPRRPADDRAEAARPRPRLFGRPAAGDRRAPGAARPRRHAGHPERRAASARRATSPRSPTSSPR